MHLSWPDHIPDFIFLLFAPEEYKIVEIHQDGEEEPWYEHKFVSSCGKVADRLKDYGINLDVIRKLHFENYAFDYNGYKEELQYRCQEYLLRKCKSEEELIKRTNRMIRSFLHNFEVLQPDKEFAKVVETQRREVNSKKQTDFSDETLEGIKNPKEFNIKKFQRSYLLKFLKECPYSQNPFRDDDGLGSAIDDLGLLYQIGLPVFVSEPSVPIEFCFTEFVDSDNPLSHNEVSTLIFTARNSIQSRTKFTLLAFRKLETNDIALSKIDSMDTISFRTSTEKGDYLEELVAGLFNSQLGFKVKKNVRRKGEEIDLIVINKLNDPFWTSLQSPIILIECKYQKKKVEPKDIRNFEVKVLDRKGLCRLGLIISISGFTKNCLGVTEKSSRDGNMIVLINKKMLQKRIDNTLSTSDWLEEIILNQF